MRPLTVPEIRRLLLGVNARRTEVEYTEEPRITGPADATELCMKKLEVGLLQYLDSLGTVVHPVLPTDVHILDTVSAAVYHAFLRTCVHAGMRWAMCRILLSLYGPGWIRMDRPIL